MIFFNQYDVFLEISQWLSIIPLHKLLNTNQIKLFLKIMHFMVLPFLKIWINSMFS